MIFRMTKVLKAYPKQFWLLTVIMMFAWTFHNMIMPFLLIYTSQKLHTSLTEVAGLFTINAIVGMATTFLGGAIADRFGRKWVMGISFIFCALSWYLFQIADSVMLFAALMALNGATTPLYRFTADAMMADMVPQANRIEAYSILRMGNNLGVVLGPAIGGFTAAISYNISFTTAGVGILICGILVMLFLGETKPTISLNDPARSKSLGGYAAMAKDREFRSLIGAFMLNRVCSATIWMMLGVYVKTNFGMNEAIYGFIPMTNAAMVILFQILITRRVKLHNPKWMMVLGASFYGLAALGIAFGQGFWAFWLCMVIATIGEMILLPTTTTMVAGLAPDDMRGRYMSIYTLTTGVGSGVGPLMGGLLSDAYGPAATWYGGGLVGFAGAAAFLLQIITGKRRAVKAQALEE